MAHNNGEPVWLIEVKTIHCRWHVDISLRPHYTHQAAYGQLRILRNRLSDRRERRVRKYVQQERPK